MRTLQAGVGGPWQLPDSGNFSIGRKACCQLVLPESYAYVSGEHCRLKCVDSAGSSLLLEDLSGNGTFINGKKVGRGKTQHISIGDEISLAKPTRKGGAIKFHVEASDGLTPSAPTLPGAPPCAVHEPPEVRTTPPATPAPASLAAAMARDAKQRQEDCHILEQRINSEKGRCSRLEEELKEAQRRLQEQQADVQRATRQREVQRDCEELRESLRRVAAECEPLERAQLAAAEAAKHDRRECARLRAELQEEQRCAEHAEQENLRLRSEVQEASGRTLALEAEVKREADFNASLEEQAAAACKEWCLSREAVSVARRRLEDRGAALTTLRTAMRQYHQKVSDRLAALDRCLQQVPSESPSQTLERRKERAVDGGAANLGSMEDETPTQDADAAAGAAVANAEIARGGSGGETPEAKRLRR